MLGRIYRIESDIDESFYIGSTRQPLYKRLKNHRSKSKEPIRQTTPLYAYFNKVGWSHSRIIIIAEFESITDIDLLKVEREMINVGLQNPNCLNKARPLRTPEEKKQQDKEYGKIQRQAHKDQERERVKQWRLNNPEKYAEQCRRAKERAREKRLAKKESK